MQIQILFENNLYLNSSYLKEGVYLYVYLQDCIIQGSK